MTKKEETKKAVRVPLHEQRDKFGVPQKKGYVRRWVNEWDNKGNRINRFQDAGWRVVSDPVHVGDPNVISNNQSLGTGARKVVGTDRYGKELFAVLMEIPQEFYDEDQAAKAEKVDAVDRQIHNPNLGDRNRNTYGPGVKSETGLGRRR